MATILQPDLKWVASFNNAGNLVAVQSVVPTYQGKPMIIQSRGSWESVVRSKANKHSYETGFDIFVWTVPVMGVNQYDYIQDTYTVGGISLSGEMTVRTRSKQDDDTYANYSAVLRLPKQSTLRRKQDSYQNVPLRFIVEAAL